jgi:hypothetical protein
VEAAPALPRTRSIWHSRNSTGLEKAARELFKLEMFFVIRPSVAMTVIIPLPPQSFRGLMRSSMLEEEKAALARVELQG